MSPGGAIFRFALAALAAAPAWCATFTLGATIRAGRLNGDWELGVGAASSPAAEDQDATPYYLQDPSNPGWTYAHPFRLSYNAATDNFTLRINTNPALPGTFSTSSWNQPGPGPGTVSMQWTIDTGGMWVSAADRPSPTAIVVDNLAFGPGLTMLQPLTVTTLAASQPGGGPAAVTSLASPVVFLTAAGSGSWYLDGTVSFLNLRTVNPANGAHRSELQFNFDITASDAPEPAAWLTMGAGLAFLGLRMRRRAATPSRS